MKVNLINCCKPKHKFSPAFSGNSEEKKPRIIVKHYEKMPDEVLERLSLIKAQAQVEKSAKMRVLKAIPLVGATILTTSIALSQPGKLSAKAASGLGFLALTGTATKLADVVNKKNEAKDSKEAALRSMAAIGGVLVGATALAKGKDVVSKALPNLTNFISKDVAKLADELDTSKFGDFFNKTVNPILEKNKSKLALALAPAATLVSSLLAGIGLSKGIAKDFSQKAKENYVQGKLENKEYVRIGLPVSVFEG